MAAGGAPAPSRFQHAMQAVRFDAARWAERNRLDAAEELAAVVLPAPPLNPVRPSAERLAVLRQIVLDPVYQLK
jgi:hypothetical protein